MALLSGRRGYHSRLLWKRKGKVTRAGHFGDWGFNQFGTRKLEAGEVTLEELILGRREEGGTGGGPLASLGGRRSQTAHVGFEGLLKHAIVEGTASQRGQ